MNIKQRLKNNAISMCEHNPKLDGLIRDSAFIFQNVEMSFSPKSYHEIKNCEWNKRLMKTHPYFKDGTLEMQSSNSSDALLMNLFCHPSVSQNNKLMELLGLQARYRSSADIEFGWKPNLMNETRKKTEVDMRIGNHIFEAKLTESDFQKTNKEVLLEYPDFVNIFHIKKLEVDINNKVSNYQLFRNIVVANKYGYCFTVLLDETRQNLINSLEYVKNMIVNNCLRERVKFITWQSLIRTLDNEFRSFMESKYL